MSKSVARRSSTASNKPKSKQRADFMKAMGVKKANLSFDEWQAFLLVLCNDALSHLVNDNGANGET
jgi:hypothetical protein